jgi:hypothetical protein
VRILIHLQADRGRSGQSSASMPHMGHHWEPACIYSSLQFRRDPLACADSTDRSRPGQWSDMSS